MRGTRKKAVAPQSSDQSHRLIESLTEYAIFSLSLEGSITSWNAGARELFGYEASEVVGIRYDMLFTDVDIAKGRPQAELDKARHDGKSSEDGWHRRKDGSTFWCTDTIQRLNDGRGTSIGYTKLVRDSTERYVASEKLRESEERLRMLIENVTEYGIFSLDRDGIVRTWNAGAQALFEYSEAEIVGRHVSTLYASDENGLRAPELELVAALRDGSAPDEGWRTRKNGRRFYCSGRLMRLGPDASGLSPGFVTITRDSTDRHTVNERMRHQAFYDELTQLPNRAYFSDCLARAISRTKRQPSRRFAVMFLDLDRFKNLNDSLGHVTADALLVNVARTFQRCVRPEDVVARFGGDEFTILLSDIEGVEDALRVADRIHAELRHPIRIDTFELFTTVSMGIAFGTASYNTAEQVLRDADTAMYEAKERGRSRYVLFDQEMHLRAVGLLDLHMDLRRAVDRGEFFVVYQPIVSLVDSRVIGFEALARWNHPTRGVLTPDDFVCEAENIGLIIEIDRIVMEEACRQLREWHVAYSETLSMSVNLSSGHFSTENVVAEIEALLERHSLPPSSLKLEITETALIQNIDVIAGTIEIIDALGVEFFIDDFGTGYSSLSYLTRLPLRLLKVDRSFVNPATANPRNAEIARTIVEMAHNLGLTALAEGIENADQLALLKVMGCEYGQGYWFSVPVRPDLARTFIGARLPQSKFLVA